MTPADRERIEACIAGELSAQDLPRKISGFNDAGRGLLASIKAVASNTAMAAHELGRESALGEIETALRELGAEVKLTWEPQFGAHCVVAVDGMRAHMRRATLADALLAAIDAVNEMRAAGVQRREIRVGDRVRVTPGRFVPPHLSAHTCSYGSNEEYLFMHRASLEGIVTDLDEDQRTIRLDGSLEGHRVERYEIVETAEQIAGQALLASKAGG